MQLTFGEAQKLPKSMRTRREVFLATMDHVVPWQGLLALIGPFYPQAGRPGRQPDALETQRRIHYFCSSGLP